MGRAEARLSAPTVLHPAIANEMPLRHPVSRRPRTFEPLEPRMMLAADVAAGAVPDPISDAQLLLPGSIAGRVVATGELGEALSPYSGISGVRLELLSEAGEVLAEAITDDAGAYEFPALTPGVYGVRELQPAGYLDALTLVGSGSGIIFESNLIREIIVEAGDQLVDYNFTEMPEPAIAEFETIDAPFFVGPMISPIVEWSRPLDIAVSPQVMLPARAPLALPPLVMRSADPIFGGSSGVPRQKEAATDAFFSDEAKDEKSDFADAQPQSSDQLVEPTEKAPRVAAERRQAAARDQAFEDGERIDAIETPSERREQPALRVAQNPAA